MKTKGQTSDVNSEFKSDSSLGNNDEIAVPTITAATASTNRLARDAQQPQRFSVATILNRISPSRASSRLSKTEEEFGSEIENVTQRLHGKLLRRTESDPSSLSFIVHDFSSTEQNSRVASSSSLEVQSSNSNERVAPTLKRRSSESAAKKRRIRPKCAVNGCDKSAKSRGLCNSHGGGKYCSALNCKNYAVSYGKCITHGVSSSLLIVVQSLPLFLSQGGKRCTIEGCTQGAKANSLCWKHGGSVQCKIKGCNRGGKTGGLCWSHGGGRQNS